MQKEEQHLHESYQLVDCSLGENEVISDDNSNQSSVQLPMRRKHNTSDIPNIALASIRHHIELCEEVVTVTAAWINSGLFSDQQTRNYKQKSYPVFCLMEEKIKPEKKNYRKISTFNQRRALHCLFRIRLSVFISFHA